MIAQNLPTVDPNEFATVENIEMVRKAFCGRFPDLRHLDELPSYAYFGIRKAVETYQNNKGMTFRVWMLTKAIYHMIDQLRANGVMHRTNTKTGERRGMLYVGDLMDDKTLAAIDKDTDQCYAKLRGRLKDPGFDAVDNKDTCDFLLSQIPKERQRIMLYFRFRHDIALKKIGKMMVPPITENGVSASFKKCFKKLAVFRDEAGFYEPLPEDLNKTKHNPPSLVTMNASPAIPPFRPLHPDANDVATPEMIQMMVRQIHKRFPSLKHGEDLTSYIYFAIRKAVLTHRPEFGRSLKSWLMYKGIWDVIDQLRRDGTIKRKGQIEEGASRTRFTSLDQTYPNGKWVFENVMPFDPGDQYDEIDNIDTCNFLLSRLPIRTQGILHQRYQQYTEFKEIGLSLTPMRRRSDNKDSVSECRISQIHTAALNLMEAYRDEAGLDELSEEEWEKRRGQKRKVSYTFTPQ